jgi:hypothetical protein
MPGPCHGHKRGGHRAKRIGLIEFQISDCGLKICDLEVEMETGMTEAFSEKKESRQEPLPPGASRLTAFEPEVLAFCCEH